MKKGYIQIYLNYFGFKEGDFVVCEACGKPATDIHHIHGRGKGKDAIFNLIALCRGCHSRAHGSIHPVSKEEFDYIHKNFLAGNRKQFLK